MPLKPFVYVANVRKYHEGEHVGTFLHLPMPWAEIERDLRDEALIGTKDELGCVYEEYAIHDYDRVDWMEDTGYKVDSWDSLKELNVVYALADAVEWDGDAINAYTDQVAGVYDLITVANLLIQSDDLPFINGMTAEDWGRELLSNYISSEAFDVVEHYFDFEEFAEEDDVAFFDEGAWLNYQDCPDMDKYDWDDVLDFVETVSAFTREELGYGEEDEEEQEVA